MSQIKMKNRWIYVGAIIVSLIFVMLSFIYKTTIANVLSAIGCSALAAAIMALFLEGAGERREEEKKRKARRVYLQQLNNEITMMIERLLWFDERLEDPSFVWNHNESVYYSLPYMVSMNLRYKEKTISFEEAIGMLQVMKKKYCKEEMAKYTSERELKIQRMFFIIAVSSVPLLEVANKIKNDKLILDVEELFELEINDAIIFDASWAVSLMIKNVNAYDVPIDSLKRLSQRIRNLGNYNNEIRIGLHGFVPMLSQAEISRRNYQKP